MTLTEMIAKIKAKEDYPAVGMIACHQGVVRAISRSGVPVKGLYLEVDQETVKRLVTEIEHRPGIVAVEVHLFSGWRRVGEEVMLVAVAGDIREHVFPALQEIVARLKTEATSKKEETW